MSKLLGTAYNYFTMWDLFQQSQGFRVSRTRETLPSIVGTLVSLVLLVLTAPYLVERYLALTQQREQ